MAHVGGERGKSGVDVLPITIPGQQPMNCEGMPQIVDTRDGALVARNPTLAQQLLRKYLLNVRYRSSAMPLLFGPPCLADRCGRLCRLA